MASAARAARRREDRERSTVPHLEPQPRPVPSELAERFAAMGAQHVSAWEITSGPFSVLMAREPIHAGADVPDLRWHISIAGRDRIARWDELVAIAHHLRPGIVFVVGVPPRSWWLNVHPHCLQLWETKDANLEAQWRAERQGHTPS